MRSLITLLVCLASVAAQASSPIIKPHAAPSPVAQDPMPLIAPGCAREFSDSKSAATERTALRGYAGTCDAALSAEIQRQITQSRLDCLMDAYEGSTDLRVGCIRVTARTPQGNRRQLHFDATWRCYKSVCPQAPGAANH